MNQELLKQANKESASVEQKQELLDVELEDVSGGVGINTVETRVDFTFDYSASDSSYKIREFIKQELRKRGVPESVISRVPVMNAEKPYMSYGSGGMRVVWEQGWPEPRYHKTHD